METDIRWQPVDTIERERPLKRVEGAVWIIVRRADVKGAAPFVISRKEWDRLKARAQEADRG